MPESKFTVVYDAAKNRIRIDVKEITLENADEYVKALTAVLSEVKPNFTGVTNVSDAKILSQEVTAKLAPTMQLAVEKGLSTTKKWAYVTSNVIYKLQWQRMFGDKVEYTQSVAEADAYLDK